MASRLKMPKLGMSMGEGTITSWLVEDGSTISVGQPLYVIATDKTEVEVESPVAGVITLIGKLEETYDVGTVIAEVS